MVNRAPAEPPSRYILRIPMGEPIRRPAIIILRPLAATGDYINWLMGSSRLQMEHDELANVNQ